VTPATSSEPAESSFTLKAVVAFAVVLFALFIGVLSFSIYRERQDAEMRGADRALAASQVVATNARWIQELSRQALGRIDEALGPDMEANAAATSLLIGEAIESLPGNVKSYVVAASGQTLFSTDPNLKPIDVRDRDYFSALATGASWYVSPLMISRLDGAQIFVFSKRLERDGNFAGAAIISFDVALLKEIWQALELDPLSTVSLVRDDGELVARYPMAEGPMNLSNHVLFTEHLKENDSGTYPAVSPADGVARLVGYRKVPGTDLVALASVSSASALAPFHRNTLLTLLFALPTAAALGGATIWIVHLLRLDLKRRSALTEALDANRLLVRDTHHRVKNNLQAIISLIRMHPLPSELKSDLQGRVSAMSAVHESLYRLDRYAEVGADVLIPDIVESLRAGFGQPVTIEYDIEPLVIERDYATPLALLISEAVTNSLKHAFRGRSDGTIRISLHRVEDGKIAAAVSDDGQGFDPGLASNGLGARLIKAMVQQLDGSYTYVVENGARLEALLSAAVAHAYPARSSSGETARSASRPQ